MPPTFEQLSLALADSLDYWPLGMVTNDLTVGLLFGEPTAPECEGHKATGKVSLFHANLIDV